MLAHLFDRVQVLVKSELTVQRTENGDSAVLLKGG